MKTGYVYILTNPSFAANFIKIGMTSKSVEERVMSLDNTSVPMPFEIYAPVQTSKYCELEAVVHKVLNTQNDCRIRSNREFFNIAPDKALNIIKDIALLLDDAIITNYVDSKQSKTQNDGMSKVYNSASDVPFWEGFISYNKNINGLFKDNDVPSCHYLSKSVCKGKNAGVRVVVRNKSVRVDLYINENYEYNKSLMSYLCDNKNLIENQITGKLKWLNSPKKSCCKISLELPYKHLENDDHTEAYKWLATNAQKFYDVFSNIITGYNN